MKQSIAPTAEIEHITPSRITKTYNPRTTFDKAAQAELESSIREHGIQQPLIARRHTDGSLELVCGERRLRAAGTLKLATVPMIIHNNLSDADADAMRLIENLQREALPALEEAEGFERLAKEHKLTQADVAARVGKSKSYVVRRMQLLKLTPKCREALRKGSIDVSGAFVLSTVADPALMDEALKHAGYRVNHFNGEQIPASEIRHTVHYRFSCELKDATFDTKAKYEGVIPGRTGQGCQLVDVGACTGCTKRTGNNEDLFGKVKGPDICTDPPCFKAKTEAAWQRIVSEQAAKGNTVLSDADCRKVFEYDSSDSPKQSSGLIRVDAPCYDDPKHRTWERILGAKFTPPLVIGRNREGTIFRMAKVADLKKSAKAAGIKLQAVRDAVSGNWSQRAEREKTRVGTAVGMAVLGEIVKSAEAFTPNIGFERWLTSRVLDTVGFDTVAEIGKRRNPELKRSQARGFLEKYITTATSEQLRGLCVELMSFTFRVYSGYGGLDDDLRATAKFFGIDIKPIQSRVTKELAAKKKAKPAAKTPAKAKPAPAGSRE